MQIDHYHHHGYTVDNYVHHILLTASPTIFRGSSPESSPRAPNSSKGLLRSIRKSLTGCNGCDKRTSPRSSYDSSARRLLFRTLPPSSVSLPLPPCARPRLGTWGSARQLTRSPLTANPSRLRTSSSSSPPVVHVPILSESEHEHPKQHPQHSAVHWHGMISVGHLQEPLQQEDMGRGALDKGVDVGARPSLRGGRVSSGQVDN